MDFLNVDFAKGTTALLKEAFKFKKYKAMPVFFAVVVGIFQIPFVTVSFLVAAFVYILSFLVRIFKIPAELMHKIVRNEKDEVKPGAQAIIYLISWPSIFLSYAIIVSLTVTLNILYFIVSVTSFVWSLGGFRFHLLMSDAENIEKNVEGEYNKIALICFVVGVALILILLPIVMTVVHYLTLPDLDPYSIKNLKLYKFGDLIKHFGTTFKGEFIDSIWILFGFTFIYTLAAFIPFPKAPKFAPAIANVVAESVVETEEVTAEEPVAQEVDSEEAVIEEEPIEETEETFDAEGPADDEAEAEAEAPTEETVDSAE